MQVTMPTVSAPVCRARYSEPNFVPAISSEAQLCAGFEEINQDSCSGDSGGPMVAVSAGGGIQQIGVVSWGANDCAGEKQSYGVYTRVAAYRDWIEKRAGPLQPLTETIALAPTSGFLREALGDLKIDLPSAKSKVKIAIEGGDRVKLGQVYRFAVTSEVAGRLILMDIDAAGRITQILPNRFTPSDNASLIAPGVPISVPSPDWGFTGFRADEPIGKGTLLALVVPEVFPATTYGEEANDRTKGFTPVRASANYLMNILQQVSDRASGVNLPGFAYEILDYEIVRQD
jgi:hypothetical protein